MLFFDHINSISLLLGEGLPMKPVELFHIGAFPVTNSMISAIVSAALIIAFVQIFVSRPTLIPSPVQNATEFVVESLSSLLEGILGRSLMNRAFWFFATIFVFIVGCNLLALIPFVGSLGLGHDEGGQFIVDKPFFRGANADLNLTASMAMIFFVFWFYWCFTELGVVGFFSHIFGSKAQFSNIWARGFFALVFIYAGLIEILSISVRPFSLSFRLFGNIYGGEYLLDNVSHMVSPYAAPLALAPFYAFEVLVAIVQAFVFCILTAAFTGTMCKHDDHAPTSGDTEKHPKE